MSNVSQFNSDVSGWSRDTLRKTRNEVLRLCAKGSGPGSQQQSVSTKLYYGEANRIIFKFPLYMVFVHKGAGRGYGGSKTGLFTRADGSKGITSKSSFGKMGSGKRVPKPWFNPVIEQQFPDLANIVTEYHGEKIAINLQRILID